MRTLAIFLTSVALTGCTHFFPAKAACPDILSAEAWIDRMPGPEKAATPLIILLRLDTNAPWRLMALTREESPAVLQLDLQPGGTGYPGSAGFRSTTAGDPERIEIVCAGRQHHTISHVMTAS